MDTLAARYVLGTLDLDERTQAQTLLSVDQEFATKVQQLERRLRMLEPQIQGRAPTTTPAELPCFDAIEPMRALTVKRGITVLLIASLVIAGVVAIYYMPQWQQAQVASKGGRRDPVPVLATAARAADVPVYLDGVGTAKALNTVTVRSQVDGKVTDISFTEGQDVPKGYVLAKIDPITYQAAYDQTVAKKAQDEAQLANARLDLERYTRLAASNAVNKQQLDTQKALVRQLEAQVKLDQAAIDNARAILSYTDVVAPIAGRTGIRLVDAGNLVRAGDTTGIVILTQLRPISVFFSLPQQNLPDLTRGMAEGQLPVDALTPDGKGVLDKGKMVVIDNQVDQTTGTVKLKAEFPNTDLQLWPGQFVNVRVLIDTLRRVVTVPTAAVQRGPNGTFVYIVKDDNTVTVRPVTLTQQNDVQVVVASGLRADERVVTTGFARLTEGTQVTVSSAKDAGQVAPGGSPPDGTRSKRGGEKGA
jgi:multidrug efflux system membrane fusion protein